MNRLLQSLPNRSGEDTEQDNMVGVIAGSVDFTGQPSLTGLAALRTGADHVRTLTPAEIHPIVASHSPNLLVGRYPGEGFSEKAIDRAVELGHWADALVVGPGLTRSDGTAVRKMLKKIDLPVVVDAVAIEPALGIDLSNTIFTPDDSEKEAIVEEHGSLEAFSESTGAVVVATGDTDTIIAEGERTNNNTGSAALTVAGTGDTLAGIVASLLSQGLPRAEAAELGAWIVGKAGELATADYGTGLVATDVIDRIPNVIR
ncbi:NAD(P)H-hydrate dehydratase [Haladaptatus pallidirubidus]|uniref:ADP-dependent (S)-NAD(P)H-hydrate dehydratase n=1 Tax=Haladaptatus pallidirubidus TaxID=1008152 RepID=A0AAV3UQU8_9EURY|nr:NAD(P)H-hydrate dehydratase [Haladaptatus pallidirubidus]